MKYIKPEIEEIKLLKTRVFLDSSQGGPSSWDDEEEFPEVPLYGDWIEQ